uniref:Glyoxalase domain-containing protein 5 n=1 Tax=Sinocyclocheilus rhinocerous TaxID=307959 RepID=A0A673KCT8_9TELE
QTNEESNRLPVKILGGLSSVRFRSSCPVHISHLDHLVLTVQDLNKSTHFYSKVLGMEVVTFKGDRKALSFGEQKLNLHQAGKEFEPKAKTPTPGSADRCLITKTPLTTVAAHLKVTYIVVPLMGPIRSLYFRDPDDNLIEVSNYQQ